MHGCNGMHVATATAVTTTTRNCNCYSLRHSSFIHFMLQQSKLVLFCDVFFADADAAAVIVAVASPFVKIETISDVTLTFYKQQQRR